MQNAIKLIREALREATIYDDREIQSITELLLEEVCSITRIGRLMHPEHILTEPQRERLAQIAAQLRLSIPVQQALGYAWFCGRKFSVSPDVLIPRPETEELISWITEGNAPCPSLPILDIGTGSGCIAITLAQHFPQAQVLGIDISEAALHIAVNNAYRQGVDNVQFANVDILTAVDNSEFRPVIHPDVDKLSTAQEQPAESYQQLGLIVSNPPYICHRESVEMSPNVLDHEPHLALFVPDDDPLLFYRAIARFGQQHLVDGGLLYFEINASYGRETQDLLVQSGYHDVVLRQDITGRDRMIKATKHQDK